jgi:hypothetical protein
MTDSACWIDTRNDAELTTWLREHNSDTDQREGKEIELGSSSWTNGLWINKLGEWAHHQGLPIEYPDFGWIVNQVSVNRTQLLQFLDYNGRGEGNNAEAIRARLQESGDEGFVYQILADDY